jgi:hypothetical protein
LKHTELSRVQVQQANSEIEAQTFKKKASMLEKENDALKRRCEDASQDVKRLETVVEEERQRSTQARADSERLLLETVASHAREQEAFDVKYRIVCAFLRGGGGAAL